MLFTDHAGSLAFHLNHFWQQVEYQRSQGDTSTIPALAEAYIKNEQFAEAAMQEYYDYLNTISVSNNRLLKVLRKIKGRTFCKNLTSFISDSGECREQKWEIVKEPVGAEQQTTEYGRQIKKYWVEGRTLYYPDGNGWAGTFCIELRPGKYLLFHASE